MSGDESYVPSRSELVSGDHAPSNIFDDPEESPDVEDYAGEERASPEPSEEFEDPQPEALPVDYKNYAGEEKAKAAKLWQESEDVTRPYKYIADKLFAEYDYLSKYFEKEENQKAWETFGVEFMEKFLVVDNLVMSLDSADGGYKLVLNPRYKVDEGGYPLEDVNQWIQKKVPEAEAKSIANDVRAKLMKLFENEDDLEDLINICEKAKRDVKKAGVTDYQDVAVDIDALVKTRAKRYLGKSKGEAGHQAEAIAKYIGKDFGYLRKFFESKDKDQAFYNQFGTEFWDMMMNDTTGIQALRDRLTLARKNKEWVPRKGKPLEGDVKKIAPKRARAIVYKSQTMLGKVLLNAKSLAKILNLCERTKLNYDTFVKPQKKPKPPKKRQLHLGPISRSESSLRIRLQKKPGAKAGAPGIVAPAPKSPTGRRTVKDVAYYENLTEVRFLAELTKNQGAMTTVWKPLMGEINATLVNTSTEADIAKKFREVVFPKWFEKYGRTGTPQDLYRAGRGGSGIRKQCSRNQKLEE